MIQKYMAPPETCCANKKLGICRNLLVQPMKILLISFVQLIVNSFFSVLANNKSVSCCRTLISRILACHSERGSIKNTDSKYPGTFSRNELWEMASGQGSVIYSTISPIPRKEHLLNGKKLHGLWTHRFSASVPYRRKPGQRLENIIAISNQMNAVSCAMLLSDRCY